MALGDDPCCPFDTARPAAASRPCAAREGAPARAAHFVLPCEPTSPDTPSMTGRLHTPLCHLLGIDFPIVQAPIGRVGGPELAAAVSNAGALGMLGVTFLDEVGLRASVRATTALTDRPFGANFLVAGISGNGLISASTKGSPSLYFWAGPSGSPYVEEAHAAGATVMLTVRSADEARRAVDAGVDMIVAQGLDAGGHVWGSVGTLALVPAVVDAAPLTPADSGRRYRRRSRARRRLGTRRAGRVDGHSLCCSR